MDAATAEEVTKLFAEVVIAPAFDRAAGKYCLVKKTARLETGGLPDPSAAGSPSGR